MSSDSYKALCTDFYVNQKLNVKLELPKTRETVLEFFERIRRQFSHMASFRRFRDELALESPQSDMPHRWLACRAANIRSGCVNPATLAEGYALHKSVLSLAPVYLSVTALDVDYIELMYGFDLAAGGNHDAIVLEALIPGSPLATLLDVPGAMPIDCQPMIGFALGRPGDLEVHFEVKTRPSPSSQPKDPADGQDPISVYLTLRKFGPVNDVADLPKIFDKLSGIGEELLETRVVPGLLLPIREAIASGNA
ncbi:MAG: hypothetical protein AB7Q00_12245 [Phycisphaerales bacterium]|nr:MAG: hypothetical protein IPK69_13005 [Phycisphaerales bacterium]